MGRRCSSIEKNSIANSVKVGGEDRRLDANYRKRLPSAPNLFLLHFFLHIFPRSFRKSVFNMFIFLSRPSLFSGTSSSLPTQFKGLFWSLVMSNLWCMLEHVAFCWSLANLPGATFLRKVDSLPEAPNDNISSGKGRTCCSYFLC